jgi:hypothetical protein
MIKGFFEMADGKVKFQDRLKDQYLRNFVVHLFNLRLTMDWGTSINRELHDFVLEYADDWRLLIRGLISRAFEYIRGIKVDGGRKDKLYREAVNDMISVGIFDLERSVEDAFDNAPEEKERKWKKDLRHEMMRSDALHSLAWVDPIWEFLIGLSPVRNSVISGDEVLKRFDAWFAAWLLIS